MPAYKVYFIDDRDHIIAAQDIRAADDKEAIEQGAALCDSMPGCAAIGVWQQARLVHRHGNTPA